MTPGTPQGRKRKIDYKPLEVDVVKVEKLRVSNQILNTEDDGGLNFNRNWKNIVKFSNKIVKNVYIQGLMGLMSLFSLYAADIAILVNGDEEIYAGFELGLTIAFFVFLTEIVLTSVANRQYFTLPTSLVWDEANETYFGSLKRRLSVGSFYFFLEFLGVMTILIDLSWAVGDVNHADVGVQVADRAGSAGRIVRLMRVMRFFNFDMHVNNAIAALKNMLRWLSDDRSVTARDDVKKEKEPKPDRGVRFEFGDEQKEEPTTEKGPDGDGSALK
ncbi:MAG: hypothetical protein VXZ58_01630, partial [Actinomycetota bacterium]|nr:hypothetical protein [Actinomycetota bacterium]